MRVGWKRYSDNIRPASPWSLKGLTLDDQVMRYHCMMPKHPICWSLTTSGSIHLWPASCRMPIFVNNLLVVLSDFTFSRDFQCAHGVFCTFPLVILSHQPTVRRPQSTWSNRRFATLLSWRCQVARGLGCRGCRWLPEKWRKFVTFQTGHFPNHHEPFRLRQNLEEPFWWGFGFPRRFLNGARQGHEKEVTPSSLSSSLWGWHLWIERFYGWGYTKAGTARMRWVE